MFVCHSHDAVLVQSSCKTNKPVIGLPVVGRLVGWLVGRLVGWSVGWLVGWLVVRSVGWLVGWSVGSVLFCSLAVLDPRVGHTMDVLSPFIPVLCHSD